jgi:hypothetical protein
LLHFIPTCIDSDAGQAIIHIYPLYDLLFITSLYFGVFYLVFFVLRVHWGVSSLENSNYIFNHFPVVTCFLSDALEIPFTHVLSQNSLVFFSFFKMLFLGVRDREEK